MLDDAKHYRYRVGCIASNYALVACTAAASIPVVFSVLYVVCKGHKNTMVNLMPILFGRFTKKGVIRPYKANTQFSATACGVDDNNCHCQNSVIVAAKIERRLELNARRCNDGESNHSCTSYRDRMRVNEEAPWQSVAELVVRAHQLPPHLFAVECSRALTYQYTRYLVKTFTQSFFIDICLETLLAGLSTTLDNAFNSIVTVGQSHTQLTLGIGVFSSVYRVLLHGAPVMAHMISYLPFSAKHRNSPIQLINVSLEPAALRYFSFSSLYSLVDAESIVYDLAIEAKLTSSTSVSCSMLHHAARLYILVRCPGEAHCMLHTHNAHTLHAAWTELSVTDYVALYVTGKLLRYVRQALYLALRRSTASARKDTHDTIEAVGQKARCASSSCDGTTVYSSR